MRKCFFFFSQTYHPILSTDFYFLGLLGDFNKKKNHTTNLILNII